MIPICYELQTSFAGEQVSSAEKVWSTQTFVRSLSVVEAVTEVLKFRILVDIALSSEHRFLL